MLRCWYSRASRGAAASGRMQRCSHNTSLHDCLLFCKVYLCVTLGKEREEDGREERGEEMKRANTAVPAVQLDGLLSFPSIPPSPLQHWQMPSAGSVSHFTTNAAGDTEAWTVLALG